MGAMPFVPAQHCLLPGTAPPIGPGLLRPLFLYAGSANPGRWATPLAHRTIP